MFSQLKLLMLTMFYLVGNGMPVFHQFLNNWEMIARNGMFPIAS